MESKQPITANDPQNVPDLNLTEVIVPSSSKEFETEKSPAKYVEHKLIYPMFFI